MNPYSAGGDPPEQTGEATPPSSDLYELASRIFSSYILERRGFFRRGYLDEEPEPDQDFQESPSQPAQNQ